MGFHTPNQLEALYLADTPVNCLLEVEALIQTERGFSGVSKSPQVLLSIEYKLNSVIDIVDIGAQTNINTNVQELTVSWRFMNAQGQLAPTQNLGEVVYSMQQVEALKVPSAKVANADNLVVFPARISGDSFLRVFDDSGTIKSQITSQ
ncbi:MAG: RES domain-containing protein [Hormoscilla sp. GM7CHS1pb]|nr:RES domain-containing protein [Hormoscilla sp. GM7CHS1pb]